MSDVIVRFVKPWQGYAPEELAGFEEEKATALVEGGVAVLASPEAPDTPAAGKKPLPKAGENEKP